MRNAQTNSHIVGTPINHIPMDVDQSIVYMQHILRWKALKKYKQVLLGFKNSVKGLAGYQWVIRLTKDLNMENFWTWEDTDANNGLADMYLVCNWCSNFQKNIWFELFKSMWSKHHGTFSRPPQIYLQWHCENFQGRNSPVHQACPRYARPLKILTPTFDEGQRIWTGRLDHTRKII